MSLFINKDAKTFLLILSLVLIVGIVLGQVLTYLNAQKFKQELIAHDYELAGYLLKSYPGPSTDLPLVFTLEKAEGQREAGEVLLEKAGYSEAMELQLAPKAADFYRHNLVINLVFSLLLSALIALVAYRFLNSHYRKVDEHTEAIGEIMQGRIETRLDENAEGSLPKLASAINNMAMSLHAHIEGEQQGKAFLKAMITNVSHQLKTPLSALMMYNEIMKEEIGDKGEASTFLDKSGKELERMESLIGNLLKLARLDAGIIELNKKQWRLADLLQEVADGFETRAKSEGKTLRLITETEVLYQCDKEWLHEAISNLVKNALDHTGYGDLISLVLEQTPVLIKISLEDTGSGIHPEDVNHVFKRFYRSRFSKDRQGVGIGLTLTRTIIEMHGGFVTVESNVNQGTVFAIHLPKLTKL